MKEPRHDDELVFTDGGEPSFDWMRRSGLSMVVGVLLRALRSAERKNWKWGSECGSRSGYESGVRPRDECNGL